MTPSVRIRPARAGDLLAAVPLIRASGPAAFDHVFGIDGDDASPFIAHCFGRRPGLLGYGNHTVATVGGEVVGTVALWTSNDIVAHAAHSGRSILAYFGLWRAVGVVRRGLAVEATLSEPGRGDLYLGHLGVTESVRGRGVGSRLLAHAREVAVARSKSTIALDVADTNEGARRLYERLGYRVTATRSWQGPPDAVPGHRRMELDL